MPMMLRISATALALIFANMMPVNASDLADFTQVSSARNDLAGPDVHALRYFAEIKDATSYQKEFARLRRQYPDFHFDVSRLFEKDTRNTDLWTLFSTGDYAAVNLEIENQRQLNQYWMPDPALLDALDVINQRSELLQAFDRGDYMQVVEIAAVNKGALEDSNVDVISAVAVALVHQQQYDAAIAAFDMGVRHGTNVDLVAVLIQRAGRYLPFADSYKLYDVLRMRGGDAQTQYRNAFQRGLLIRANQHKFGVPPNFHDGSEPFGEKALVANRWDDIQLLAWNYYIQGSYDLAYKWFSAMPDDYANGKVVEGTILSLKMLGRLKEAVVLAKKWKDDYPEIAKLYINLTAPDLLFAKAKKLSSSFLTLFADITKQYQSGEGAEALGWYAFNVRQTEASNAWFDKALEWNPTETATFGKTLVASQMGDREAFDRLKEQYADEYPSIAKLEYRKKYTGKRRSASKSSLLSIAMANAHKAGQYRTCVNKSDQLIALGKSRARDYEMRGWCLMKLDRPSEAKVAFMKATNSKGSGGNGGISNYGTALAALEQGRTHKASEILNSGVLNRDQTVVIQRTLWAQQAIAAFNAHRYRDAISLLNRRRQLATEPRNLNELRAWSLYYLGDLRSAYNAFSAMDQVLSTHESRNGLRTIRERLNVSSRGNG